MRIIKDLLEVLFQIMILNKMHTRYDWAANIANLGMKAEILRIKLYYKIHIRTRMFRPFILVPILT